MTLRRHVFKQGKGRLPPGGFSLLSAIFLLLVLAALGAAIANISMTQHTESALDIQGVRAYQAARAGVEWGVYQVEATPAYNFGRASTNPNLRACPDSPSSFQFSAAASTFSGFTVTVSCNAITYANANPPITVFQIVSTACNQPISGACPGTSGGTYYVERQLSVKL